MRAKLVVWALALAVATATLATSAAERSSLISNWPVAIESTVSSGGRMRPRTVWFGLEVMNCAGTVASPVVCEPAYVPSPRSKVPSLLKSNA